MRKSCPNVLEGKVEKVFVESRRRLDLCEDFSFCEYEQLKGIFILSVRLSSMRIEKRSNYSFVCLSLLVSIVQTCRYYIGWMYFDLAKLLAKKCSIFLIGRKCF